MKIIFKNSVIITSLLMSFVACSQESKQAQTLPKTDTTMETLAYYGGYTAYCFVFKKRWSSTYVYSYLHQQKPASINNIFKYSHYFAANAVYAFNKYFTMGGEVLYGVKANYDNSHGNALRLLGVVRLLF